MPNCLNCKEKDGVCHICPMPQDGRDEFCDADAQELCKVSNCKSCHQKERMIKIAKQKGLI